MLLLEKHFTYKDIHRLKLNDGKIYTVVIVVKDSWTLCKNINFRTNNFTRESNRSFYNGKRVASSRGLNNFEHA